MLGKPWAWIKDAELEKQTNPAFIVKSDKHKVDILSSFFFYQKIQLFEILLKAISFNDSISITQGLTGYTIDVLKKLSKEMNFDYEIVLASGNQYGHRY